jgi:hypothetical protein
MIDAVAALWARGKPLSEIGQALGVSRGKIAGAIDRARKAGDRRFGRRPPPPKAKVMQAPRAANVAASPPAPPRLMIDWPWNGCRWPVGLAADERHLFCGSPC